MSASDDHAIRIEGEGDRTLVLMHGYGCDQTMWDQMVPLLRGAHRLVRYDLMGSGRSAISKYDRDRYATLQGHADDLMTILDELELERVTLVGHSVSAMTAALAARAHPDRIDAVVMVCPSPSFIDDAPYEGGFAREDVDSLLETLDSNYLGWSTQMAPAIMGTPDAPENGELLTRSFCQADPDIARHFARVTFTADHRSDLPGVTQPTLILQCRDDVIVPASVGAYMRDAMPRATLTVLDATGHCPHISAPLPTAAALTAFLGA